MEVRSNLFKITITAHAIEVPVLFFKKLQFQLYAILKKMHGGALLCGKIFDSTKIHLSTCT